MILRYFLKGLLLPPTSNLLLIFVGFLVWRITPRIAKCLVAVGVISLWLFSTPWFAAHLVAPLDEQYPVLSTDYRCNDVGAIVILGGGLRKHAPEYGDGRNLTLGTLARLRYGATLAKRCEKPVLVTGGRVFGDESVSEAEVMAQALESEFNVPVRWQESRSRTTQENAVYTSQRLKQDGVESVVLVTSALHMPRSVQSFQSRGLEVIAAPTGISSKPIGLGVPFDWLPNAGALLVSRQALHEYMGILVYRVLY